MRRVFAVLAAAVATAALAVLVITTIGVATDSWRIVPVRSGSMESSVPTGSVAITRPVAAADLTVGDIVVFHPPSDPEQLVIHRVVEMESVDGAPAFRTRGDANAGPDPWTLRFEDDEVWRVARVVPGVGRVELLLTNREVRAGALAIGAGLVLAVGLTWIWRRKDHDDGTSDEIDLSGRDDDGPEMSERVEDSRVRVRTRAAFRGTAALGLFLAVALVVGQSAHGTFTATATVDAPYASGTLDPPNPASCVWTPLFGTTPVLWLVWITAGQEFATGYHASRSDTSGGPYSLRGTLTPNTNGFYIENPEPHTQVRYYVVDSFRGNWTSTFTNQVASNECRNAINAYAGDGTAGFSGDGGPATSAQLNAPEAVAVDGSGNTYIADTLNNRIRKVDPSGTITTFAGGSGAASACGYTGPVADLRISGPYGVAVDSADNVYISDSGSDCIRKVDADAQVSLVAGGGATATCNATGAATALQLDLPAGLLVDDDDDLYVADAGQGCIRKISGGTYSHVAGGGATGSCTTTVAAADAQLLVPVALAMDSSGAIYWVENYVGFGGCARKASGGTVSNVAGGGGTTGCATSGAASSVSLLSPSGIAIDAFDRVFISDRLRNCVRLVEGASYRRYAFTGTAGLTGNNGPAIEALGTQPSGLAFDASGDLSIVGSGNNVVRRVIHPQ